MGWQGSPGMMRSLSFPQFSLPLLCFLWFTALQACNKTLLIWLKYLLSSPASLLYVHFDDLFVVVSGDDNFSQTGLFNVLDRWTFGT